MNDLAKRIKERREELGLSQTQLAFKLGYKSRSSINKIEKGENDIPPSKIKWFAEVLNISPAELMGWDNAELKRIVDNAIKESKEQKPIIEMFKIIGFEINQIISVTPPERVEDYHKYVGKYDIEYDGNIYSITAEEFENLYNDIKSYMRFKILELKEKHIND